MATPPAVPSPDQLRWRLLRDLGSFVLKVALETVRDLVLIPLALLAGLAGLLLSRAAPDRFFREVLRLGARFDEFLDLFGPSPGRRARRGRAWRPGGRHRGRTARAAPARRRHGGGQDRDRSRPRRSRGRASRAPAAPFAQLVARLA
jgi:hypothetical protein